jgi:Thioredoxin-like
MLTKRYLLAGFAFTAAVLVSSLALAADKQTFDAKAFESAQAAGKPILVEITASWCPTCKAQAPILQKLTADPKFKNLVRRGLRYTQGRAEAVQGADAEHADRVQGHHGAGPLDRRHARDLDRRAFEQGQQIF